MTETAELKFYTPAEERINIASHAAGLLFSLLAMVLLLIRAAIHGNAWHVVSYGLFGFGLVALYGASTAYHSAREPRLRRRLRTVDHASIFILIAGTYTPFALVTLNGPVGWVIFGLTWGMAVTGVVLKLFYTGRYNILSVLMYVFMGWLIIFFIGPLVEQFPAEGLNWLFIGGAAYTLGAVIYSIRRIPFNHAIFHLFVLLGSFCHFVAVYRYVLPVAAVS